MREVAALILSLPEECPVIVLSAMGKTTKKILLAGEKAMCGESVVAEIDELRELHHRTVDELGLDRSIITYHLEKLERLVEVIAELKEFTPRTRDYLVSFGERMSTRVFAAYLNKLGVKALISYIWKFEKHSPFVCQRQRWQKPVLRRLQPPHQLLIPIHAMYDQGKKLINFIREEC